MDETADGRQTGQSSDDRELPTIAFFDASLRSETGHQANACRQITRELINRGFAIDVFASQQIEVKLRSELSAIPHFRLLPYEQSAVFGRIDAVVQETGFSQDLRRGWSPGRHVAAYFNSVLAPQLLAIIKWLESFPRGNAPPVAIEFGAPSGLSSGGWFGRFAAMYRNAGTLLRKLDQGRLLLFTFDEAASAEYSDLFGVAVATLPAVHALPGSPRRRKPDDNGHLTVAFLGQQRIEKGVHLLPEVIAEIRRTDPALKILVQDGDVTERPISRQLSSLSENDPGVTFVQRPADPEYWRHLMDCTDLLVLPYEPARYKGSYSAIAVEAVGAGIPMVVPAGTTLENLALRYQGKVATFHDWTAPAVIAAVREAALRFDELASAAFGGASQWSADHNPIAFVDQLQAGLSLRNSQARPEHACPGVSPLEVNVLDALIAARDLGKRAVHSVIGAERNAP